MKKYLLMTVGTGKEIEKGMLVSIENQNPDKVIFFATEEAMAAKKDILESMLKEIGKEGEWFKLSTHEDFEKALEEIGGKIETLKSEDTVLHFDITFGTKPITAVMAYLGFKFGKSISYITGKKRDEHGKVISGEERLNSLPTTGLRVKEAIKEAVEFYNRNMFLAAKKILEDCIDLIGESHPLRSLMNAIIILNEFNIERDNFNFDLCVEKLRNILQNYSEEVAKLFSLDKNTVKKYLEKLINQFEQVAQNNLSPVRISELVASAKRSANFGRYNDATARLYRTLEFIAQIKLYELGKLDDEMYLKCRVIDGECVNLENYKEKPAGLVELYKCLYHLGFTVASKIYDPETEQPSSILSYRNKSILAHGFKSIDEKSYKEFLDLVENVAKEMGYDTKPLILDLKIKNLPFSY